MNLRNLIDKLSLDKATYLSSSSKNSTLVICFLQKLMNLRKRRSFCGSSSARSDILILLSLFFICSSNASTWPGQLCYCTEIGGGVYRPRLFNFKYYVHKYIEIRDLAEWQAERRPVKKVQALYLTVGLLNCIFLFLIRKFMQVRLLLYLLTSDLSLLILIVSSFRRASSTYSVLKNSSSSVWK